MKTSVLFFFIISTSSILFSCSNKHTQTIIDAEFLISSNPDSALILLKNINNPKNLSEEQYAHFLLFSTEAKDKINADISMDTLLYKSINYFKKKKEYDKVAQAYFYENRVYQSRNCIQKAIKSGFLAKEYAEKFQDFNLLGLIHHDLGCLYKEQLNFQETIDNFKKSILYFQKSQNKKYAIYTYKRIGDIYLISRQIGYTDSASIYYQKALKYAEQENNQYEIYHIYKSISLNLCETNQLEEAKTFIKKAIDIMGNSYKNFGDYILLAGLYVDLNKPDSAITYANLSISINTNPTIKDKYAYQKLMYRINYIKGNTDSAFLDLEKCLEYKDSIYTNILSENILEIQKKYEKESLENEKNELLIERLHLFILYMLLFILLSTATGLYIYKNQKQKENLFNAQQTVGFLEEMLQTKNIKENKLKDLLIEKLDITRKVTQMNIQPGNNNNFIKQYHKIFGYNIAETLNWKNLYPLFNELYNNIVDKLKEFNPKLSEKEIQFCCLIRAEFRHDEIAFILSYEYNSIRTIKMRLRMKMGFNNYDDFNQFLMVL